ncbi:hypothetical protein MEX01_15600 [Methylorubrum extorquens]|nr:hypothetical protein MEX01_15600 [Methylorubrum extorquens]
MQERVGQRPVRVEAGIAQRAPSEKDGEEEGTAQRRQRRQHPVAASYNRHGGDRPFTKRIRIDAEDSMGRVKSSSQMIRWPSHENLSNRRGIRRSHNAEVPSPRIPGRSVAAKRFLSIWDGRALPKTATDGKSSAGSFTTRRADRGYS